MTLIKTREPKSGQRPSVLLPGEGSSIRVAPSIAYHEAGHAALAIFLGLGLKRVSIVPDDNAAGRCTQFGGSRLLRLEWDDSFSMTKWVEKQMMVALAGMEAQRKFAPSSIRHYHGSADVRNVFEFAFKLSGCSEEASAHVHLLQIRTRNLLNQPDVWRGVKALAKRLLEHAEVSGREARRIVDAADQAADRRFRRQHPIQRINLPTIPLRSTMVPSSEHISSGPGPKPPPPTSTAAPPKPPSDQ